MKKKFTQFSKNQEPVPCPAVTFWLYWSNRLHLRRGGHHHCRHEQECRDEPSELCWFHFHIILYSLFYHCKVKVFWMFCLKCTRPSAGALVWHLRKALYMMLYVDDDAMPQQVPPPLNHYEPGGWPCLPPSHLGNSNKFDCSRFGVGCIG